jgi:hypothetical protein
MNAVRPLSFAIVITLWGTERIARRLETLRATTSNVLEGDGREPFREMNSVVGPVVASAASAIAFALSALVGDGWTSALLRGATWFVLGIAGAHRHRPRGSRLPHEDT